MGNLRLALFLAYKSIIRGSRWTLVLIVLVMSLSFANLVLIPSILAGVTRAIDQQQIDTLFGNIIIDPPADQYYLENINSLESRISSVNGLAGIAPHLNNQALIEYRWQDYATGEKIPGGSWSVIGIDPAKEPSVTTISTSLVEGSYLVPEDSDRIVLGVEIAGGEKAENQPFLTLGGVRVGDRVRLTYAGGVQREYTVKGIFKAREGGANSLAFVTRREMASVMGMEAGADRASQILIRTQPGSDDSRIIENLQGMGINGQVRSWLDYGAGVGGIVSSFGVIASLIGGIGLVVAGVVMFIVIYINVANRKRQIGILRAIGVNRKVVLGSYLVQSLLFGVLGIIFGGLIFGYLIKPFFDAFPIELPIGLVSLTVEPGSVRNAILGLIAAAVLAGILPVMNITRLSIIKAIWGN